MRCKRHGRGCPGCTSVALIGHSNVGKSVLFHQLTGSRAIVSNYPGTTVELARGTLRCCPEVTALDTPGLVTLPGQTEDENATVRVLFEEPLKAILQVGDAKNISRTLLLTLQLGEMGIPLVLALNMMDEAGSRGVRIDHEALAQELNLPVVPTVAVRRDGVDGLPAALERANGVDVKIRYPRAIESALDEICAWIPESSIAPRGLALLFLSSDCIAEEWLAERLDVASLERLRARRNQVQSRFNEPLPTLIQRNRMAVVQQLLSSVTHQAGAGDTSFADRLGRLAIHPLWGVPILGAVLYSLYLFVGVFGAQTMVDWLEGTLFGAVINPWLAGWIQDLIPWDLAVDFLVGEYGLWSMGMTYALALILPIVTTFFLAFGVLEDSGYFSRLAALANREFRRIGLNGKAVLPMVLGLGCVTMATLTTRTLETKRDRFLVTLLLALAVPCSAQLGVVMGILAGISFGATVIWGLVLLGVLFSVGWLADKVIPGDRPSLLLELPPLRLPLMSNVLMKTLARLEWYLREVIPLFLLGTTILFLLDASGALPALIRASEPITVAWLGLPAQASEAFLLGFLRRDFGAAGLFMMNSRGLLSPAQSLVAIVTITLFVPCVASIFMIAKERGYRTAVGMAALIFPLAIAVGGLLSRALSLIGWGV